MHFWFPSTKLLSEDPSFKNWHMKFKKLTRYKEADSMPYLLFKFYKPVAMLSSSSAKGHFYFRRRFDAATLLSQRNLISQELLDEVQQAWHSRANMLWRSFYLEKDIFFAIDIDSRLSQEKPCNQ
jgi:hypothetical protein